MQKVVATQSKSWHHSSKLQQSQKVVCQRPQGSLQLVQMWRGQSNSNHNASPTLAILTHLHPQWGGTLAADIWWSHCAWRRCTCSRQSRGSLTTLATSTVKWCKIDFWFFLNCKWTNISSHFLYKFLKSFRCWSYVLSEIYVFSGSPRFFTGMTILFSTPIGLWSFYG